MTCIIYFLRKKKKQGCRPHLETDGTDSCFPGCIPASYLLLNGFYGQPDPTAVRVRLPAKIKVEAGRRAGARVCGVPAKGEVIPVQQLIPVYIDQIRDDDRPDVAEASRITTPVVVHQVGS